MLKFSSGVLLRGGCPCSPIRNQKLSICPTWVGRGVIAFRLGSRRIAHISFLGVVRASGYLTARWVCRWHSCFSGVVARDGSFVRTVWIEFVRIFYRTCCVSGGSGCSLTRKLSVEILRRNGLPRWGVPGMVCGLWHLVGETKVLCLRFF